MHTPGGSGITEGEPGVHPMAAELEGLTYEAWQLEVSQPVAPA